MDTINRLFNIKYPIIQGGMIWCSGWELASAVSNAGGLGLIGSGSMYPEVLRNHIKKCKEATRNPFGVNVPLLYPNIEEHMKIIVEENVKIVFTSAGNPKTWTNYLKQHNITVVHVVSNVKFAVKCQEAGVDAIVAEGFEAGGHNGREETTTMVLIPQVRNAVSIPIMAAGGISSGKAMAAALALGAQGVQVGTRFATTLESSAHINFKNAIVESKEGGTQLSLKQLTPVRLLKNAFYEKVSDLEKNGATAEELTTLLGRGRAKKGMFEGDMDEGELEIGQVSATIDKIETVKEVIDDMIADYNSVIKQLQNSFL
jgi:enoyl-[acyl-carrier protein] reductase II